MTTVYATEVGKTSKGTGRLWFQGEKLLRGQFAPTTTYKRVFKNGNLMLIACKDGEYTVSGKKAKSNTGRIDPVIDICNKDVASWWPIGTKLRAIVRKGKIIIRRAAQIVKQSLRSRRILAKLAAGTALSMVSMFAGAGVMDRALHEGMTSQGINVRSAVVAEIESAYLDANMRANAGTGMFDEHTVFFNGPVQDFDLGKVIEADLFCAGIPCTGASTASRARLKTSSAEAHPDAGTMFFTTLEWIKKFQPGVVILENVKSYASTASMTIVRSLLGSWDYEVHEMILNGNAFGALENRDRLVIVAVDTRLAAEGFNPETIVPLQTNPATLAEVLDPVAEDDERWNTYQYLADKEVKDLANGKGFRRQLYTPESESVATLVRGYAKIQSTNPFLLHPTKPGYMRLFTEYEHGRIKGVPAGFVEALGVSRTIAHQCLGQSVVYPVFVSVGAAIGRFLSDRDHAALPDVDQQPTGQLELVA